MNIFYLDKDPTLAALYHCDKHVVKMILESAQLLSTAHRVLDGVEGRKVSPAGRNLKAWVLPEPLDSQLYVASHVNHPSAIWTRSSHLAYEWLYSLMVALGHEYSLRYNKIHLTNSKLNDILCNSPKNIPLGSDFTEPTQAMPDYCKIPGDAVTAYRNYYNNEKHSIAIWNYSDIPHWFQPKDLN